MNPTQLMAIVRMLLSPLAQLIAAVAGAIPKSNMTPKGKAAIKLAVAVAVVVAGLVLAWANGTLPAFDFASALRSILDAAAELLQP